MKRDVSNASLASSGRGDGSEGSPALNLLNDEATGRLLFDSTSTNTDSASTHSAGAYLHCSIYDSLKYNFLWQKLPDSSSKAYSCVRLLARVCKTFSVCFENIYSFTGSVSVATNTTTDIMDTSSSPTTVPAMPNDGGGVITRGNKSRKKKMSSRRGLSKNPTSLPLDSAPPVNDGASESKSVPSTPDHTGMESEQNRMKFLESESKPSPVSKSGTSPEATPNKQLAGSTKVRLSASYSLPLVIEEPVEEEEREGRVVVNGIAGERVRARSPSPSLTVLPSPRRVGFSPSSSPRNTRKTRMAGRRGSRCESWAL